MTQETEDLVLEILRKMQEDIRDIKMRLVSLEGRVASMEEQLTLVPTRDEMNARFDEVADLATVVVSAQADTIRRVEDLEGV